MGGRERPTVHLVRHLATEGCPSGRVDRHGLRAWFDVEAGCGVVPDAVPSDDLVGLVATSRYLAASPLPRAQATAAVVLSRVDGDCCPEVMVMDELREAPLPVLPVPWVRLTVDAWDMGCRIAWPAGYSGGVEPRGEAVARARAAACRVRNLAASGTVTVIAHGFLNMLVVRELRRRGWSGPRLPRYHHGASSTYLDRAT